MGFGTGEWGDVYLYEWGTDPNEFYKSAKGMKKSDLTRRISQPGAEGRSIRAKRNIQKSSVNASKVTSKEFEVPVISYRELSNNVKNSMERRAFYDDRRQGQTSRLTTTRAERILKYQRLMQPVE